MFEAAAGSGRRSQEKVRVLTLIDPLLEGSRRIRPQVAGGRVPGLSGRAWERVVEDPGSFSSPATCGLILRLSRTKRLPDGWGSCRR